MRYYSFTQIVRTNTTEVVDDCTLLLTAKDGESGMEAERWGLGCL